MAYISVLDSLGFYMCVKRVAHSVAARCSRCNLKSQPHHYYQVITQFNHLLHLIANIWVLNSE